MTRSERPTPGDFAEVAPGLGRIDVRGADDPEAFALGHLPDDARANWSEADVQDPDRPRLLIPSVMLLMKMSMNATLDYTRAPIALDEAGGVLVGSARVRAFRGADGAAARR